MPELKDYLIDVYDELYTKPVSGYIKLPEGYERVRVLCEGAQGFGIDISWGNYPYVTSSHCGSAGAMLSGINYRTVDTVYGVCKAYDTYVGSNNFQPDLKTMNCIQKVGQEFGATTGRTRQVNYLDLKFILKSCVLNGVTDIIINKVDILKSCEVLFPDSNPWCVLIDNNTEKSIHNLGNESSWKTFVENFFKENLQQGIKVTFSESPYTI